MKTRIFFLLNVITCLFAIQAQDFKFGHVGSAILEETHDSIFTDTPAKTVFKRIVLDYGDELEIHERIKIYNEDGFEYSNWEIPFSDISYLQGYTYNLENGVVEKTHVKKSSIFKEEISSDYEITKISFPKVKKGSVIELKYRIKDIRVREIPIQYIIPVKNFRLVLQNVNSWMDFKQNPNYKIELVEEETDNEKLKIFTAKNIPASKQELFVNNPDNYRGRLFIKSKSEKEDEEKWASIASSYNNATYFGDQLQEKPFFRKDIQPLLKDKRDTLATSKIIYEYVQKTMEYNGMYSTGVYGMQDKYKDKKGGKGTINLLLTAILRDVGYNANPMVVACKHRGEMLFPEKSTFNVTICSLQIGGDFYLLDASEKNAKFGVIPVDLMNDYGLVILEDGRSISFPTRNAAISVSNAIVSTKINLNDNTAFGTVQNQYTNHLALEYKDAVEEIEDLDFEEALEELNPLLSVSDFKNKEWKTAEESVQFSYNFTYKDAVEEIAGTLYVAPFLFLGTPENKFDDEERLYPIDLEFPKREIFNITFHIPEGYVLESVPENKKITLQENLGSLIFIANQQGQLLQLKLQVDINYSLIPATYYGALQELFIEYTKISKSKIVLSKR